MEFSSSNIKKILIFSHKTAFVIFSQKKLFLYFQKWNPSLFFSPRSKNEKRPPEKISYISGNDPPKKNPSISGSGTFL